MLGLHKPQSLFRIKLDVGELMWLPSFRHPERYFPPGGDGKEGGAAQPRRVGLWAMMLFFAVFPLSRNGFRSLHGWALSLGPAGFIAALPVCAALFVLQIGAAVVGSVMVTCFAILGGIYAMCAFGDTKITLRWLQDFPHLVVNVVYTYYYAGSIEQWINMSGSALMIIKGLAGDVVFSLKVFVRKEALKQAGSELGEGPESKMAQITQLAPLQLEMNQGIEGRQQPGTLPPEMVGMPSDGDPCLCAGAPLDPCTGRACAACTCATCCSAQRRSYTDALSTLYGVLSFREALWTLTGAPLASFAVFCLPVINFASIPAWYWLTGCGPTDAHAFVPVASKPWCKPRCPTTLRPCRRPRAEEKRQVKEAPLVPKDLRYASTASSSEEEDDFDVDELPPTQPLPRECQNPWEVLWCAPPSNGGQQPGGLMPNPLSPLEGFAGQLLRRFSPAPPAAVDPPARERGAEVRHREGSSASRLSPLGSGSDWSGVSDRGGRQQQVSEPSDSGYARPAQDGYRAAQRGGGGGRREAAAGRGAAGRGSGGGAGHRAGSNQQVDPRRPRSGSAAQLPPHHRSNHMRSGEGSSTRRREDDQRRYAEQRPHEPPYGRRRREERDQRADYYE